MKFTVEIETPSRRKPVTRADDLKERAALQQTLLQVVEAVSNCGRYEGTATGEGATAKFGYSDE
jgi:hypothetical protein